MKKYQDTVREQEKSAKQEGDGDTNHCRNLWNSPKKKKKHGKEIAAYDESVVYLYNEYAYTHIHAEYILTK